MRSLKNRIVLTAAAVALLAPPSLTSAKDQVPLKGSITIVPEGGTTVLDPPFLRETRLITGVVSHLGRVEGVIMQDVNVRDQSFSGVFTLFAANGDSVTGTAIGVLLPTVNPNVLEVSEEITITGGTGRFAGATGSAKGVGQAFRDTERAEETFQGTISSPGSSKK